MAVFAQEPDTTVPSIAGNVKLGTTALYYDAVRAKHQGDFAEATRMMEKVIELDPQAAGAYYDLAKIYMVRKQNDKAEGYIKKAISLHPENKWYQEQYAILLMEQNKFKKAAAIFEGIIETEENDKEYLEKLAYVYQRGGDTKRAIEVIDKLIALYGNDEELIEKKLQIYINNNQLDDAVLLVNEMIEQVPHESSYYVRLAEMYNNSNQSEKAAEVYKKAEARFPDDAGIQLSLSEYYKNIGDTANYKKYLKKVITNNSLEASTQLTILQSYILAADNDGDRQFATDMANRIAVQNPDNAQALHAYGNMLAITNQFDSAAVQYKKSLDIDQSNFQVWKNLLSVYAQQLNADSLIEYSSKALRLFPTQAHVHFMKGMGHNQKKEYDQAANSIQRAIDMMPEENRGELASMYAMLADVYNNQKDYEASDENFDKALKLDPDNPTTLNNYSYYLSVRKERLDEAEKMSKRSLELAPELPTFLDTYGWILYQKGEYKKAKEYIELAIKKEEANASGTLWEHLGDIYFKLGERNKAMESWRKAKELGTDSDLIDKKIKDEKLYE